MNPKEYISSGILEQYVLGMLSAEQRKQVEAYAQEHPVIRNEIERLREALEQYATLHAIEPDPELKARVMANFDKPADLETKHGSPDRPANGLRGLLWLAVIALAVTFFALMYFWNANRSASGQLNALQERFDQLRLDCQDDRNQMAILEAQLGMIRDAGTEAVRLQGTDLSPESRVHVYWNPELESTLLDVVNLPAPPSGRQYQLWALVDGNPVDMGVISLDPQRDTLTEVPFIEDAGAFAITLEPEGGSVNPTLDQMYVIGNISTG